MQPGIKSGERNVSFVQIIGFHAKLQREHKRARKIVED